MMNVNMEFIENDNKFDMEFEGTQTINGKSAYEIAVENGYVGTEIEWLESLHGKDGYTPVKGKDYFTEAEVSTFKEEVTPKKGVDYTDGYTPQKGVDYFDGEKGDPFTYEDFTPEQLEALKGADGYTPVKGTDYYTDEDKAEMLNSVKSAFEPDVQAINQTAEQAMSIAKGRATAYIYDTVEDLETALANEEFVSNLVVGDNFYIRALEVPDYWWDGEQKQELETEKPDLTGLVKSDEVQTMIDNSLAAIGVAEEGAY